MSTSFNSTIDLGTLALNDPDIWNRVHAHFRERQSKMTSSASTATPMKHSFESRVAEVKLSKNDTNLFVHDYLVMEGYIEAAAKFRAEANLQPAQAEASIEARRDIRQAILTGNIDLAVNRLNELDPDILDSDPQLHFSLLRLQLVELIRKSQGDDITEALDFATQKLAPRASTDAAFLQDLEKTMALLIFPHDDTLKPELAALLKSDLRRNVADGVNKAILYREIGRSNSALWDLTKTRAWSEHSARQNKRINLPDRIRLGLDGDGKDSIDDPMHENGHEPMITT